jgi:DNA-directed RNA polymerase specialized sigma subunit
VARLARSIAGHYDDRTDASIEELCGVAMTTFDNAFATYRQRHEAAIRTTGKAPYLFSTYFVSYIRNAIRLFISREANQGK